LTGAALLSAGVFTPVRAQDPDDLKRGVARISLMNGEVSVRRGDSADWVAGVVNAPLLTADQVATGPNSRAEIQFDSANMLRIGGNGEIHMADLENRRYQLELARGTITFRVLRASDANVEVDTPSVSVRPSRQGSYRITVKDTGETEITVRSGDVEVFSPRGSQWVNTGQTMQVRGTAADPEFQIVAAIPPDDWDRWNDSRDTVLTRSVSPRYVGPGVYGTEDMDAYGTWGSDPDYGPVWRPTVGMGVGWAPYQCGSWVWEDWYGWTWVGCEPWGWAPYHYGRWFFRTGFGWGWYPGLMGVRHYWSPAMVGFFGFGGGGFGFGVGFGFGNIGWVPLAPYEMFYPWWGRGLYGGFNRGLNITNANITSVYRNARVANAISGVSRADFGAGRFNSIGRFSGSQIGQAGVVRGAMPITPTSANLRFSNHSVTNAPRASANTHFFAHQQASPAARTPFAEQQRAMERSSGAAMSNRSTAAAPGADRPASAQSAARSPQSQSAPAARSGQSDAAGGWRRFGEPGSSQSAPRSQSAPQNGRSWNGFGNPGSSNGAPRQQYSQPQSGYRGNSGSSAPRYNSPQSLRIAPPVVQQRSGSSSGSSAPRSYSSGSSSSRPSGGGGGHSSSRGGGHR
jgi:hypothetical protein